MTVTLVRAGKFLSLMQALPPVAVPAFESLTRVFDLYLYNVAANFVPQRALHAVFALFDNRPAVSGTTFGATTAGLLGNLVGQSTEEVDEFPYRDPVGSCALLPALCQSSFV